MSMRNIMQAQLSAIYDNPYIPLDTIATLLKPELPAIVDTFYAEFLQMPETVRVLNHHLIQKSLRSALSQWVLALFAPSSGADIAAFIRQQERIGSVHANINVRLSFFTHGIGILKREIYARLERSIPQREQLYAAFLLVEQLLDITTSIIVEAYLSNEIHYESNELSMKMKGITQNTAIECERLRTLLLDWLRTTLTLLYQTTELDPGNLPKLQYSTFGLWVIYKSDLLSHTINVSDDLKRQIHDIDDILFQAAQHRAAGENTQFFESVNRLNDAVTKTSWFISSLVDQMMEIDRGTDALTRLFNRRYLDTILRRQTEISIKQGLPYAVLMIDLDHFKQVNDGHGHDNGDIVLKAFAEILLLSVRTSDFIFRYGGEEFLVLLGNADLQSAWSVAEKIRTRCEMRAFKLPGDVTLELTCSIGISIHDGHPDYHHSIQQADTALYAAKRAGRNRTAMTKE